VASLEKRQSWSSTLVFDDSLEDCMKKSPTKSSAKLANPSLQLASMRPNPMPSDEAIRMRAYELFSARGGDGGHDVEDWLQAEQELKNGRN
jgi:Protein of unknown function (DUF2934)